MKVNLFVQTGIVFSVCLLGEIISAYLPFVFPANVLSMIILFLLLISGILKVHCIEDFADFLLKNMAFFFIPSAVALLKELEVLKGKILILLFICLATTLITFFVTAFTVRLVTKLQNKVRERC